MRQSTVYSRAGSLFMNTFSQSVESWMAEGALTLVSGRALSLSFEMPYKSAAAKGDLQTHLHGTVYRPAEWAGISFD